MQLIFRSLVAVSMVVTMLFWSMPLIDYMWYSNDQLALLDQGGLGATLVPGEILYWSELGMWLLVSVGLLIFIPIARTAFVVLYLVSMPLTFFYGIQVLTPLEAFLSGTLGLLDGAIITIMFFTSVSERFRGSP